MSLLEKIISRKSAVLSQAETIRPATAVAQKISDAEISPAEKKTERPAATVEPCQACGLPAFWISVYEIAELENFERRIFSSGEAEGDRAAASAGTPATLDDHPRPACLRCPECSPAPAASLVGARVVIIEPRSGQRRLVRCDASWQPLETTEAPGQAEPGEGGRAADRPDLDDSPATLVELLTGANGQSVKIWTRQPTGILRRVAWTLASFPE